MRSTDADPPPAPLPPLSKTRRKKDMHALQSLGEALVALTPAQLRRIALPERLADAIAEAKRIPGFEARRRQMQYIGKIMRDVDAAAIAEHVERIRDDRRQDNAHHHDLERWRERLLAEDAALAELAAAVPAIDMQQVRALVRNARNEQARGLPPKSSRALFRMLRETMSEPAANEPTAADDTQA